MPIWSQIPSKSRPNGAPLAPTWAILGGTWASWRPSWGHLGASLTPSKAKNINVSLSLWFFCLCLRLVKPLKAADKTSKSTFFKHFLAYRKVSDAYFLCKNHMIFNYFFYELCAYQYEATEASKCRFGAKFHPS